MKVFIVSIILMWCSVRANPTPQIFGYQPATPVGQWLSNGLQNSLQSVANAIQTISRPSQIGPNQIPHGPEAYGPVQTIVQPVPVPVQTVYQPNPYPQGPYQPGYQPVPYPQGPYGPEIHVIPVQPNGIPYRNIQNDESKNPSWVPVPLYSQFGEPTIVIISRPPSKPAAHQNETSSQEHPVNSTNTPTDADNTTTNFPQNEQTSTPTTVPTTNYGTTSMFSPGIVPQLGLSMVNQLPIALNETAGPAAKPNTN